MNDIFFVAQYTLTIAGDKAINASDDPTKTTDVFHTAGLGVERLISGVWIFDEVIPRAGLRYTYQDENRYRTENDAANSETRTNPTNTSSEVVVTAGLGINKGIAAIDVAVQIGNWAGVLTGPSVISGTLTLDFGKSSGSSSSSGYQSAPSPAMSSPDAGDSSGETTPSSSGSGSGLGDFEF